MAAGFSEAADYYVAPTGSDSNAGTMDKQRWYDQQSRRERWHGERAVRRRRGRRRQLLLPLEGHAGHGALLMTLAVLGAALRRRRR